MSRTLKKLQQALDGIGTLPRRVIRFGTVLAGAMLLFSVFLADRAQSVSAYRIALAVTQSGVWLFAESIIGGLLLQSYADRHSSED